ncbi:MAG: hypothetical protein JWQ87_69 [Candidatus Sulfotelmatobacter sp.]|nr:hypothetical protein [Candidatus Sulfotelmatobacter sp.]
MSKARAHLRPGSLGPERPKPGARTNCTIQWETEQVGKSARAETVCCPEWTVSGTKVLPPTVN